MIFGDPRWLWGFIALPLLLVFEWRAVVRSDRALAQLVGARPDSPLLEQRRPGQRRTGLALRLAALSLLLLGAADPQWGRELVRRGASGSDFVLALDVSASMDVRDVPPSRLEEARREALAVLERLEGSRVSVIAFAGDAVRTCPLTLDRGAVRLALESAQSGSVSEPGTDLGRALRLAVKLLPPGRREEQAVVIWTDGEDLERGANSAIEALATAGIRVFTVGVGTAGGDMVPVLDDQGRAVDIKRDENGGAVRSRLDEGLLRNLARRTRGAYFSAARPGGELPRLLAALGTVSRSGRGQRLVERPVSRFPLCALLAVVLLLADRVRPRRRWNAGAGAATAGAEPGRAANGRRAAVAALLALLGLWPGAASGQSFWARANRAYQARHWSDAESLYAKRIAEGPARGAEVNRATARAQQGKTEDFERELARLARVDDPAGRAAGYNLGTSLGGRKEYDGALEALRHALERDPKDHDARWNYEVLLLQREREKQKSEPQPKPKPQPSPSEGGQGGSSNPPPSPGSPPPSGSNPSAPPSGNPPPTPGVMDRTQANQLLNALDEQARREQSQRRVRVVREKHGRDW